MCKVNAVIVAAVTALQSTAKNRILFFFLAEAFLLWQIFSQHPGTTWHEEGIERNSVRY